MDGAQKRVYIEIDDVIVNYTEVLVKDGYYGVRPKDGAINHIKTLMAKGNEVYILVVDYDHLDSKNWWVRNQLEFIPEENIISIGTYESRAEAIMTKFNRPLTKNDMLYGIIDRHTKEWEKSAGSIRTSNRYNKRFNIRTK